MYNFALKHSGLTTVHHSYNTFWTFVVYGIIIVGALLTLAMIIWFTGTDEWDLAATTTNFTQAGWSNKVSSRTKNRAFVASMFSTLTFSLTINASIDKFGDIDPSTSTVLIGMLLGNTWGFVLDNMLGSDEGFREYLWSSSNGMAYAIGSLGTAKFARYMVTILFDMFFTVILFKRLYTIVVRWWGFSTTGREWIANGLSSTVISFMTFQVYANMTRLEWAYPSGTEDDKNPWISGSTMVLAVVTMSIVYLIDESRSSFGERGINDPPVKICVVLFTFVMLAGLQKYGVADPSNLSSNNKTDLQSDPMWQNTSLRLSGVCETYAKTGRGLFILAFIVFFCLGFVIFVTSKQTFHGLKVACCRNKDITEPYDPRSRLKAKTFLFVLYVIIVMLVVATFSFVPFWSAPGKRGIPDCP
mmetsp:Transcript_40149/g.78904  ORF Transcript_40149/g.78904 Transcript_40149/m.78904 type:complete len:415 (+) Transcript_40149:25-1269(+)